MNDPISAEFARNKPELVAQELEKFTVEDVLEYLDEIDDVIGARVASRLSTRVLIRVLEQLSDQRVSELLCAASPRAANALLAHIPGDQYQAILDATDADSKSFVQTLFGMSAQTIGLLTSNHFVRVYDHATCGAVVRELAESEPEGPTPIVAVDNDGVYRGVVPLMEIMHVVNADRPIEDFLIEVQPLNRSASVDSVLALNQWDDFSVLPVVDSSRRLEGVVGLRKLRRQATRIDEAQDDSPFYSLLDLYFNLCADVLAFLVAGRKP